MSSRWLFPLIFALPLISGCMFLDSDMCSISVTSQPTGVKVILDSEDLGTTPLTIANVAYGRHAVEFRHSGYYSWENSINIDTNKLFVHIDLSTREVQISEQSPQNAEPPSYPIDRDTANPNITLSISNTGFNENILVANPGAMIQMHFENQDIGVPHNFALYSDEAGIDLIFKGNTTYGPDEVLYTFEAPVKLGVYYFRCDSYPDKEKGVFIVNPRLSPTSNPLGIQIEELTIRNHTFDKELLEVRTQSGDPQTLIMLHNQDEGVAHNFALYRNKGDSEAIYQGPTVIGPNTTVFSVTVPFIEPNSDSYTIGETYYFGCSLHPHSARGKFVVKWLPMA